jgi:hypothetical protein
MIFLCLISGLLAILGTLVAQTGIAAEKTSLRTPLALGEIPSQFIGLSTGDFINLRPSTPFGTARSWDAGGGSSPLSWADINPAPGRYDFLPIDEFIAFNDAHGSQPIFTFGRTPSWAASEPGKKTCKYRPGECSLPADLAAWDDFVRAIVTHAAGKIKYWELWNEPQDPTFYSGDIRSMVTMAQHARRIIKSIDPTASLLGPAVTGPDGPGWLAKFLSEGGGAYIDVVTFHGYWSATAEDILNVISNYRRVTRSSGVADLPIWDTEASWAGSGNIGTPTTDQQVAFIPKYLLLHWSQNVSRVVWYQYDGGPIWGGLESNGIESPAAESFAQTYRWLVGAVLTEPCSKTADEIWTCHLSRPGAYSGEVVWNSRHAASIIVPSGFVEYRDLTAGVHPVEKNRLLHITNKPILLETRPLPRNFERGLLVQ